MGVSLSRPHSSRRISIVADGMSRRAAVERFGVADSAAVRWVPAFNTAGVFAAKSRRGYGAVKTL